MKVAPWAWSSISVFKMARLVRDGKAGRTPERSGPKAKIPSELITACTSFASIEQVYGKPKNKGDMANLVEKALLPKSHLFVNGQPNRKYLEDVLRRNIVLSSNLRSGKKSKSIEASRY